jgi:hypothetical protein
MPASLGTTDNPETKALREVPQSVLGQGKKKDGRFLAMRSWDHMMQRCYNPKHDPIVTMEHGALECGLSGTAFLTSTLQWVIVQSEIALTGLTQIRTIVLATVAGPHRHNR